MNTEEAKTVIGEDVEISGNVKCENSILLNGKLNGDLTCATEAIIGHTSAVKGNMSVEAISIQGQVNGNITAKDKIELKATARLHGDIRAKRLTVEDGVTFVGKVEVNPTGTSAGNPPQPKAADEKVAPTDDAEASDTHGKGMFRR